MLFNFDSQQTQIIRQLDTTPSKFNWLILLALTLSLGITMTAISQLSYFRQGKELIFTAWGNSGSEVDFSEINIYNHNEAITSTDRLSTSRGGEAKENLGEILGVSTSSRQSLAASRQVSGTNQITYQSSTHQGWLLDQWFKRFDSPLVGHGDDFVRACRQYGAPVDCTLLPAISKVETAYCTAGLSLEQYNCWGFGGSGPNRIWYNSFEESIDEITRRLMTGYGERFFRNPNNGGLVYCGAHCVNWGDYVLNEQNRIKRFYEDNGLSSEFY